MDTSTRQGGQKAALSYRVGASSYRTTRPCSLGYRAAAACLSPTSDAVLKNSTARSNQVSSPKTIAPLPPKTTNCSLTFAVIT